MNQEGVGTGDRGPAAALAAAVGGGPQKVAGAIVDAAMRASGVRAAWLFLADDEASQLRLLGHRGFARAQQAALEVIPYSSDISFARVAATRVWQVLEDTAGLPGAIPEARGLLAVPVWGTKPGRMLGVLATGYPLPHRFTPAELARAEELSALATLALTAATEHEEKDSLRRRLAGVRNASLAVAEMMSILPETALLTALKRGFHLWPAALETETKFLKDVLSTIVEQARELVDAEFAALGAGDDPSVPFDPWVQAGMGPEVVEAIGRTPRPVGTLGVVAIGGEKIRTPDVREHPAYRGVPANHPPIISLLAVPIRYGSVSLGNLYLANKRGGRQFSYEDERLVELLAAQVSLAMQQTYLQSSLQTQQAQLQGVFESATAAIMFVDAATGRIIANAKAMQLLGRAIRPEGGREQYLDILCYPDGRPVPLEELPSSIALTGRQVASVELEVVRAGTSRARILESAAPVLGLGRKLLGAVVVMEDITAVRELQRVREDFAAMVVHDLRSPLQTIVLDSTRLAGQSATASGEVERLAQRIARSAKVLSGMTQDLLDASQLEAGYLHLNLQPVEPQEAVKTLLERIRPILGDHPVETRFEPPLPWVQADPLRVAQVLTNILDNAAKYSAEGSPIRVAVEATAEGVKFSVHNEGPGIPPEVVSRLFQRYSQSPEARATGQGRGLGLFIARGIVEAHRGRIWVESRPGQGATFCFLLPRAAG